SVRGPSGAHGGRREHRRSRRAARGVVCAPGLARHRAGPAGRRPRRWRRAGRRGPWSCAAAVAIALGILSKESAITVIAAVVAGDLVYRRRTDAATVVPLGAGAAAALVLRTLVTGGVGAARAPRPLAARPQ